MKPLLERVGKLEKAVSQLQHEILFKGQVLKDTQAEHQFKVGDLAKIIKWDFLPENIGLIGKVIEIKDDEFSRSVGQVIHLYLDKYIGANPIRCFMPNDLELVKVDYEAKYNQAVKTIKEKEDYISELHSDFEEMKKNRDFWKTSFDNLEAKLKSLETAELKKGDKVEVIDETNFKGCVGVIEYIYSSTMPYPYYVFFENKTVSHQVFAKKDLKKVG